MDTPDVLIVGAGPAGCSAAMTLRMRNLKVLVFSAAPSALEMTKRIDNYPGLPSADGKALQQSMRQQAVQMGAEIKDGSVRLIMKRKKGFDVLMGEEIFSARTVLLACGAARKAAIEGEEALLGNGISYCATCDGMLYRGGHVAVAAEDESAAADTAFLKGIASTDYYALKPHTLPEGMTDGGKPLKVEKTPEGKIRLFTKDTEKDYDCVFILRPSLPPTSLVPGLKTEGNAVGVDDDLMTSVPGVFAAGDMTGLPHQAARAVGQGNVAALAIARYLSEQNAASVK